VTATVMNLPCWSRLSRRRKVSGSRPTAHVAIDGVGLLLHHTIPSLVLMGGTRSPVFVQAVADAAQDQVIAQIIRPKFVRVAIAVADGKAPRAVVVVAGGDRLE